MCGKGCKVEADMTVWYGLYGIMIETVGMVCTGLCGRDCGDVCYFVRTVR